jgi:Na+/H+ antiporter NhaC
MQKRFFNILFVLILLLVFTATVSFAEIIPKDFSLSDTSQVPTAVRFEVEKNSISTSNVPFSMTIKVLNPDGMVLRNFSEPVVLNIDKGQIFRQTGDKLSPVQTFDSFESGVLKIDNIVINKPGNYVLSLYSQSGSGATEIRVIPGYLSILPPLIAIVLALTLKQVFVSILLGILLGSYIIYDFNLFHSLLRSIDTLLIKSILTKDHISIIIFDFLLGGMVGVISASGGNLGLVNLIRKWAKTSRGGQIATWAMGILIFFDDYANTLIVGNSMRPITDKMKISREKLAYIVDSTAAPMASIALISTWIGFELGVIGDSLRTVGASMEPYIVFIRTIPFRFYPILVLSFIFMQIYMKRDFGPMFTAEKRARTTGQLLAPNAIPLASIGTDDFINEKGIPCRWYNAFVPILTVILLTIVGLWYSGVSAIAESGGPGALQGIKIHEILNNANSFNVLMWASAAGSIIAIAMVLVQKIMNLEESVSAWIEGAKALMPAIIILTLAWTIGGICRELNTGPYLASIVRGNIAPQLLPLLIFILSALISFATGTSWGTMSIVMPIAVYIGFTLPPADMAESARTAILLGSISGVLAGGVFGDHCSPISDTTIMSSMASACDHIDHVRTQMPYALTVAGIGTVLGTIPAGYGFNPYLSMLICIFVLYLILRFFGKDPEQFAEKSEDKITEISAVSVMEQNLTEEKTG